MVYWYTSFQDKHRQTLHPASSSSRIMSATSPGEFLVAEPSVKKGPVHLGTGTPGTPGTPGNRC